MSYRESGVNIDGANQAKRERAESMESDNSRVLNKIGACATLYDLEFPDYREPVLVLKTEEPGSKQLLAFQYDRIESIYRDMINHLINAVLSWGQNLCPSRM